MHSLLQLEFHHDAYVGEQLCFKEGMFPKLKKLQLIHLKRLRSLIIEETALPMLEELVISPCPEMTDVPSGLQHLKKLKNLEFNLMPLDFLKFQDFQTVFRVPQVWFSYGNDDGQIEWIALPDLLETNPEFMQG
ncbi:hypothetical protein TIFTF001_050393 [Ficus carica]|uniref:Uncharacterized protein n=1 Tax=Ficus carica TaxID=3494 RepID=A0AA87Z514_FICCA|nr:hypothetical protein TIFTF001_050393 [Ficus carica]